MSSFDRHKDAIVALDKAIALEPSKIILLLAKARSAIALKEYGVALKAANAALALDDKNLDALLAKGSLGR